MAPIGQQLGPGQELLMPKKKPKGGDLSEEDKEHNRIISGLRIVVEQAIGGIKRLVCVGQVYRNRKGQDDRFILLSSGLWNYHLSLS